VTRLDEIGIPVHVGYRPCGKTLAVSIGIGLHPAQSWVGAVMESIESWHAEDEQLPVVTRDSARSVDPGYDVRSLNLGERSPLTDRTVLDWVAATGLLTGQPRLVPRQTIRMDGTGSTCGSWSPATGWAPATRPARRPCTACSN
jgi:ribosomal protein S12 methylthiotransferase accessory factor